MSKHTPGPWSPDYDQFETGIAIVPDSEPSIIVADVWPMEMVPDMRSDPVAVANARLICAAPDLLAACEAVLDAWASGDLAAAARMCAAAADKAADK